MTHGHSDAEFDADYVIVGAGSAGCVLANRLSEQESNRVLLIEAGGDDRPWRNLGGFYDALNIHIPVGFTRVYRRPSLTWGYLSEPEPGRNGRSMALPRGKVLGGSSSINGLIFARGLETDFDQWRQAGCIGWGFEDVLPFFKKSEHRDGAAEGHHGRGGPLVIGEAPLRHPLSDALIAAAVQAGLGSTDDMNGPQQEGATRPPLTLRNGLRQSTAVAFLHPALKRRNLRLVTHAFTEQVVIENGRATGVRFTRAGVTRIARARRAVILASGALNSPKLLQLSGIGPGALLQHHGIAVQVESPAVGERLQDHFSILTRARLKPGTPSMNEQSRGWRLALHMLRFMATRTGLLSLGGSHVTGFVKSRPGLDLPDLQIFSSPGTADVEKTMASTRMVMEREPGLTLNAYKSRPLSRGHVRIASPHPQAPPQVLHNFLAEPADVITAVDSLKMIRRVLSQPAIAHHIDHEITPGGDRLTDAALLDYARATGGTSFHEAGSVAMGPASTSPLDARLRVNGIDGLRVMDASVMPAIVSGNTNAATIMIAEKGAAMILADARA